MQQNGEKNVILCRLLIKESFVFFFFNSRWISEGQCYTHSVCFWVSVFSWFQGKNFFPFWSQGENTHKHISVPQTLQDGPFSVDVSTEEWKGTPLTYQHSKRIWNAGRLLHANPFQLLWELRRGHSCLGKFRAQNTPPPLTSPPAQKHTGPCSLHPLISDFHHQSLEVHFSPHSLSFGANANKKCLKWLTFPVTEGFR